MKKTSTLSCIVATLGLCLLFTSCSKDEKIAMRLSGEWEGYWGMYYYDPMHPEWGEWDSDYSTVVFQPYEEYGTNGDGYQIDWYSNQPNDKGYVSPYERMTYHFTWRVVGKNIILNYPVNPEYNVTIKNGEYDLSKKHFMGYFNNSTTRFDLMATSKFYSWWDYARLNTYRAIYWTWVGAETIAMLGDDYYNYYYYGKTRSGEVPVDSAGTPVEVRTPVQIGNRFAEE